MLLKYWKTIDQYLIIIYFRLVAEAEQDSVLSATKDAGVVLTATDSGGYAKVQSQDNSVSLDSWTICIRFRCLKLSDICYFSFVIYNFF